MKKKVHLRKLEAYQYNTEKGWKYYIVYDHGSGNQDRYHVWACTEEHDMVMIGCELPLKDCRRVILEHDKDAPTIWDILEKREK